MTSRFPGIKRVLHFAFGRRGLAAEIDEELQFHLERTIEELEAGGMSAQEAKEEAERRFGNLPDYRAALTRIGEARRSGEQRKEYLDIVRQHLRYTWRGIVRQPGFAITIAVTLALGIGANAIMFGIIDRLMLRAPEHIVEPERVRRVFVSRLRAPGAAQAVSGLSRQEAIELEQTPGISGLARYSYYQLTYGQGAGARTMHLGLASSNFFRLLGTKPALGRFFLPSDDSTSADNSVAVLSYGLWHGELGADPAILGQTIEVSGHRFTVIGVAPESFSGPELAVAELWLPQDPAGDMVHAGNWWRSERNYPWVHALIRLKLGADEIAVARDMLAVERRGESAGDSRNHWAQITLASLLAGRTPDRGTEIPVTLWLAGTSILVLLIACANVAILLLARATTRRREIAVRLALGVTRLRLASHLMIEGVLLALAGGLVAALVTAAGSNLIRKILLPQVAWSGSAIDVRTALFTGAVALLAGVIAGLAPAWLESRPELITALKSGTTGGGFRRSRVQVALVVAQATISVALLIGAGLFVHSLAQVRGADIGLDADRVLIVFPEFSGAMSRQAQGLALDRARLAADRMPSVERTALSSAVPFSIISIHRVTKPNGDSLTIPPDAGPYNNEVSPEYFETMGTRLVQGRLFSPADGRAGNKVVILSRNLAELLYPNMDPVGRCFDFATGECLTIVGTVSNPHWHGLFERPAYSFYQPLVPGDTDLFQFLSIRVRLDVDRAIPAVHAALLSALPEARSIEVVSLQDHLDPEMRPWRLGATLFLAFGALALIVAAIGLYSVMACRVAQRRHELGVRTALGASWGDLIEMVAREGIQLVGGGILLGLLVAVLAAPAIAPLLYQTSPRDPQVLLIVVVVLLVSALVACALPAWRASRVDPMEALKAE